MADVVVRACHRHAPCHVGRGHAHVLGDFGDEGGGGIVQRHAVLRALRAGEARHHRREVQLEHVGEDRLWRRLVEEHLLRAQIGFHQLDAGGIAAGEAQIVQRLGVHREEAAGGAVFGRHVGDGRAVGDAEGREGRPEELDELADDALLAEHLGDGEHQVGGRRAFRHAAGEAEADDVGDEHGDGLAEHGGFRLDAADTPAEHAGAVHHGGVAVGSVERVRVRERLAARFAGPDHLAEIFQVHLVADAGAWRHTRKFWKASWPQRRKA